MNRFPKRICEHVYLLGNDFFPIYLVQGKSSHVLIEGGVSFIAPLIFDQLKNLKIPFSSISYLVVLHSHSDHVMAIPYLKKYLTNVKIAGSEYSKELLIKEKVIEKFSKEDVYFRNLFFNPFSQFEDFKKINIEEVVAEGSCIDLGNVSLEFIDSPGHSPCSLSVFIRDDDLLLISDAAGFPLKGGTIFPLYFSSFRQYIDSLEKLKAIEAKQLGIGHFGTFKKKDIEVFLEKAIKSAYCLHHFIKRQIQKGTGKGEIEEAVFRLMYQNRLKKYSKETIKECAQFIAKRSIESEE